jgi:hypothetical protein
VMAMAITPSLNASIRSLLSDRLALGDSPSDRTAPPSIARLGYGNTPKQGQSTLTRLGQRWVPIVAPPSYTFAAIFVDRSTAPQGSEVDDFT